MSVHGKNLKEIAQLVCFCQPAEINMSKVAMSSVCQWIIGTCAKNATYKWRVPQPW